MDITIYDLMLEGVNALIDTSTERYGRIIRKESSLNNTVDMLINVKNICISDHHINITFPDNSIIFAKVPSNFYHKIEVM